MGCDALPPYYLHVHRDLQHPNHAVKAMKTTPLRALQSDGKLELQLRESLKLRPYRRSGEVSDLEASGSENEGEAQSVRLGPLLRPPRKTSQNGI